jgi:lysophospholipase L1-like esterase
MPTLLNEEGFSLWDSTTIEGKTRFMEYGSRLADGSKVDLSKRADFVKALTKEQAEAYSVYNVLSGADGWNPAKAQTAKLKAADVTLDNYVINLPLGESTELKAIVLPAGASSSVSYKANNDCVSVDGNKITENKIGTTRIYAQLENGISTYATVTVTSARTQVPEINAIKISSKDTITTGDKLTASYSYALDSDNKADKSLIRWYSVKDGKATLLKSGIGDYYKTYTVQNSDAGSYIMLGVRPATATTYGEYGEEKTVTTKNTVVKAEDGTDNYLSTGFTDSLSGFKVTDGNWKIVTDDGNGFAVPATTKASMEAVGSDNWNNATYSFKLRVNPNATGLGSEDSLSFSFNSNDNSCYRLDVTRGSNTKSLRLNLYKVENGTETALYTDEDKLKGIVLTNSGEDNTNVYITFAKSDDKINLICTLEGADTKLIGKTITDSNPLSGGSFKADFDGKSEIWQLDNVTVDAAKQIDKESQIRVYLAGDSTVKDYGDDNSIGGWGEYIKYYFDDGVEIINKAEGGRSTRSYLNQGRLDEITSQLREGDYVFIQFGHNDNRTTEDARVEHSVQLGEPDENGVYPTLKAEKTKTPQRIVDFYKNDAYPYSEYFYPYESGTFKWYLKQYIEQVRAKGATPVIITPVCRVLFDADGKIQPAFGENNGYKVAAEQAAEECGVACIDAYSITQQLYEGYGVLTTQGLHDVKDDGTMDLTHYNKFGANIVASKLAAAVGETIPELQSHIIVSKTSVSKTDDMKTANLFVVGDSGKGMTDSDVFSAHGYTEYMQDYFNDKITVRDYTIAGATAKSFASTKAYTDFINSVNEGDYVMISFGRYDSEAMAGGYTRSGEDKENANSFAHYIYYSYVKPVTDKKAIPVLLTPINNRVYGTDGTAVNTSGDYTADLLKLVTDGSLSFVNVSNITYELYKNMGEEGSKVLNALDSKNGYDNKAFSEFGAQTIAKQIVNSMKYSSATLKNYILDSKLNELSVTSVSKSEV